MNDDQYSQDARAATHAMIKRWQALAAQIAAGSPSQTAREPDRRGKLLVLGSGISHIDLTLNDESQIKASDFVFHCLYDRVTQIWIQRLRPDAYDLRILYSPNVDRHDTYVCMAEAMLYHVRRGKSVVAIFYGHPGLFATPTHRAIRIAHNEGHIAKMRPGISALDYLIADVGFDPMIPGLLSYEATDLLLRRRRLDPSLHVVLWQVGAVGEFQFDPGGFKNRGFDLLVRELQDWYGPDWEIVHYIAPQYVGVDPLIERHAIGSLLDPRVRSRVGALSTFYIEPQAIAKTDPDYSARLGFLPSAELAAMPERAYDLACYDRRETDAIRRFERFNPPDHYAVPPPSPAADFMLALSRDLGLQAQYRADPQKLLSQARFNGLSERARNLLAIQHPLAINAAIAEPGA